MSSSNLLCFIRSMLNVFIGSLDPSSFPVLEPQSQKEGFFLVIP